MVMYFSEVDRRLKRLIADLDNEDAEQLGLLPEELRSLRGILFKHLVPAVDLEDSYYSEPWTYSSQSIRVISKYTNTPPEANTLRWIITDMPVRDMAVEVT